MTIADVPVGVLLSGGLDSSLLVALLAESASATCDLLRRLRGPAGGEGQRVRILRSGGGTLPYPPPQVPLPNDEVLERLPEAVDNMAEPMFGQDAVAFYLLSEQVSQHVKVVQSGQGADEVFGGYFWYPRMAAESGSDLERFRAHYFDRDHEEFLEMVGDAYRGPDYTGAVCRHRPGRATGRGVSQPRAAASTPPP
jgi:asparagine synthase (glutamine-hydrolysing)